MPARVMPSVERVAGGVWSLPVPIPNNPLGYTLVYLLESDRGPVLVDAGWHAPETWEALLAGVTETGHDLAEVDGVVVTHHHPDHHGLAGRVREASGAWIAMHPEDIRIVKKQRDALSGGTGEERWRERVIEGMHIAGAPAEALAELLQPRELELPALPDRHLTDGEFVDVAGRRVRAVWTPGHSPGHTCLHLEEMDGLLAGDHLLPTITPHVGLYEQSEELDPLGDFLSSLAKIEKLAPRHALPAHEERFDGVVARAQEIAEHHEERLQSIVEWLPEGGATIWEIAESMPWAQPWDDMPPSMRQVALGEAGAHIRHLRRRGDLEPVDGTSPPRLVRA